jgi:hypothetical protein
MHGDGAIDKDKRTEIFTPNQPKRKRKGPAWSETVFQLKLHLWEALSFPSTAFSLQSCAAGSSRNVLDADLLLSLAVQLCAGLNT